MAKMASARREQNPIILKKADASRNWIGWPVRVLVGLLAGSFLLFLGIPLAALLLREPPALLWSTMQRPEVLQALQLSFVTTLASTLLGVLFGLPV
ncbi:MAG: hypothetical protein H0W02_08365, partial [Ktedonobacteraceae bacterium]|nr:hypothetical protein [Ktedonobacteraceae bacterium]